jgi:hypothetical protein
MLKKTILFSFLFIISICSAKTYLLQDLQEIINNPETKNFGLKEILKSKNDFDKYEFIIEMLTNRNAIEKKDNPFSNTTWKSLYRELLFLGLGILAGITSFLPLAKKNISKTTKTIYFCAPTIITYLLFSICYQNYQKNKIGGRILNSFLKNWKYYKQITPEELHKTFDTLNSQYLKNKQNLNISENEAQEIIAQIFKICIGKKT